MKKTTIVIAIANCAMLVGFALTMLIFGNKPGAASPAIIPFYFYLLISPVIAFTGVTLGVIQLFRRNTAWKSLIFNVVYLIAGIGACTLFIINGDTGYQRAQDPVRIKHATYIASVIEEYKQKTGHFPMPEELLGKNKTFMVFIGRSVKQEDEFSQIPALRGGALFANSSYLEGELSRVLQREIVLPRDPQKVTTFAPNIYVYYSSPTLTCIYAHLFEPTENSKEYEWSGGTFYSHPVCLEMNK